MGAKTRPLPTQQISDPERKSVRPVKRASIVATAERQCTYSDNYNKVRMYVHHALKE
jgi:hypothetical protein